MTAPSEIWPRGAASAAIFRGGMVLLAERGQGPGKGTWSLPGGKIEAGETAAAAAVREIAEETGLAVDIAGLLDVHDVMIRDGAGVLTGQYLLAVYYGTSAQGTPVAATDISDARFVPLAEIGRYRLTHGAVRLIREASKRLNLS
jgi:8-oxo-dGTP diphosphatase